MMMTTTLLLNICRGFLPEITLLHMFAAVAFLDTDVLCDQRQVSGEQRDQSPTTVELVSRTIPTGRARQD